METLEKTEKKTYNILSDADIISKHGRKGLVRNALMVVKAATDFETLPQHPEGSKRDKEAYYVNVFNQALRPSTPKEGVFGWFFGIADENIEKIAARVKTFKNHVLKVEANAAKKPLTEAEAEAVNIDIATKADEILNLVLSFKPERVKGAPKKVKLSLAKRFEAIEI